MRRTKRAGFTLPELLVSLGLLSVVLSGVVSVVVSMQRGYVRQREMARAEDALRVAETTVSSMLRAAGSNPHNITGSARPRLEPDPLGNGAFDNLRVVSDFNPANGATTGPLEDAQVWVSSDTMYVRWQAGQTAAPVAFPVRSLVFEYFDEAGTAITDAALMGDARRVRFTLTAPSHTRTSNLARRVTWVYLRNPL